MCNIYIVYSSMDLYHIRCCALFNRLLTNKPETNFSDDLHFPSTINMYMEWLVQHRLVRNLLDNTRVPNTVEAVESYKHCHAALLDMGGVSAQEISSMIENFNHHKHLQDNVASLNRFTVNMLAFESACKFQVDHVVAAWWIYQSCFHHTITMELTMEQQVSRAELLGDKHKRNKLDTFISKNVWRFLPEPNFYNLLTSRDVGNLCACIDNMHRLFSKLPLVIQDKCKNIRYSHAKNFRQSIPQVIQSTGLKNAIGRAHMIWNMCLTNHQAENLSEIEAFFVACLVPETRLSLWFTKQDLKFVIEHHFPTVLWASSGVRPDLKDRLYRIISS